MADLLTTVPQGYILFRESCAPLVRRGNDYFIPVEERLIPVQELCNHQLGASKPVLLAFEGICFCAEYVCRDPLVQVLIERDSMFEFTGPPAEVSFKKEGDKTYRVVKDGNTEYWYWDGKLHREGDQPAMIQGDYMKSYYIHGKLHRDGDKPAYITKDGMCRWHQNGQLHRDGRPAYADRSNNDLRYYINGQQQKPDSQPSANRMEAVMFMNESFKLGGEELPDKPENAEDPIEVEAEEELKDKPPEAFRRPTSAQGMNRPKPNKPDVKDQEFPRSSIRRMLNKKRPNQQ